MKHKHRHRCRSSTQWSTMA